MIRQIITEVACRTVYISSGHTLMTTASWFNAMFNHIELFVCNFIAVEYSEIKLHKHFSTFRRLRRCFEFKKKFEVGDNDQSESLTSRTTHLCNCITFPVLWAHTLLATSEEIRICDLLNIGPRISLQGLWKPTGRESRSQCAMSVLLSIIIVTNGKRILKAVFYSRFDLVTPA
jgi:hypothetical protein